MKLRYVQAWVDDEGRPHQYFRRHGFKTVPLPGLPGSCEFMASYQEALDGAPAPIGAKRTVGGSVSAAIVRDYASVRYFGSLAPGTQAMRRAILERFRADHGDKPIAGLPPKFIALMLDQMK